MDFSSVPMPPGTFTIGKTFDFEGGHRLPCLEEPGFVTDFGALAPFKKFVRTELDHRNLHEILPFEPTSERLAQFLAGWFIQNVQPAIPGRLVAVRVRETGRSWARFDVEGQ